MVFSGVGVAMTIVNVSNTVYSQGSEGSVGCQIGFKAASCCSGLSRACYSAVFIATIIVGMKYICPLSA